MDTQGTVRFLPLSIHQSIYLFIRIFGRLNAHTHLVLVEKGVQVVVPVLGLLTEHTHKY